MANAAEWAKAAQDWMRENVTPQSNGNFYQTRITRTPGMVTPVDGAAATYNKQAIPSDIVRRSSLTDDVRDKLASFWSGQRGFIESNPGAASKTLKHEQIHDIVARTGLDAGMLPMLDPGVVKYVQDNPIYKGINPAQVADEGLAYQLTSGGDVSSLRDRIVGMLAGRGQNVEAEQLMKLTK
jgi:hypothetical protein